MSRPVLGITAIPSESVALCSVTQHDFPFSIPLGDKREMGKRLLRNSAICNHCKDEIESKHCHDYVSCKCGRIAVDGGKDYTRRAFQADGDYTDTSVYAEEGSDPQPIRLSGGAN